jgi:hypothetical protein
MSRAELGRWGGSLQTCKLHILKEVYGANNGREARLVDDDMNDVEIGKEGEMLVRGPTIFR